MSTYQTVPRPTFLVRHDDVMRVAALVFAALTATVILTVLAMQAAADQGRGVRFGDGAYRVAPTGADLAPGVYATAGRPGGTCRWWTTNTESGRIIVRPDSAIDDIPPVALRLQAGTTLHTQGCGTWGEVR